MLHLIIKVLGWAGIKTGLRSGNFIMRDGECEASHYTILLTQSLKLLTKLNSWVGQGKSVLFFIVFSWPASDLERSWDIFDTSRPLQELIVRGHRERATAIFHHTEQVENFSWPSGLPETPTPFIQRAFPWFGRFWKQDRGSWPDAMDVINKMVKSMRRDAREGDNIWKHQMELLDPIMLEW